MLGSAPILAIDLMCNGTWPRSPPSLAQSEAALVCTIMGPKNSIKDQFDLN